MDEGGDLLAMASRDQRPHLRLVVEGVTHAHALDGLLQRRHEVVDGRALRVVTLPMPEPLHYEGYRLPASYANFYVANGLVLVPTFNDPADRRALAIVAELFPDRRVAGIHAVDLVLGLGTLHCLTQQEPA